MARLVEASVLDTLNVETVLPDGLVMDRAKEAMAQTLLRVLLRPADGLAQETLGVGK